VLVALNSDHAEARRLVPSLLEQFSNALATQLNSFFMIRGEIVKAGKPLIRGGTKIGGNPGRPQPLITGEPY